jgi:hypothetical protein
VSSRSTYGGATLEVPAPSEAPTPIVPDSPSTPMTPDPGTPIEPGEPSTVPGPSEPAEPIAPSEPSPELPPEPSEPQTEPASWARAEAPDEASTHFGEEATVPAPAFPPIPISTDPQRSDAQDDALEPAVPAYGADEPAPDPAPDWLTP